MSGCSCEDVPATTILSYASQPKLRLVPKHRMITNQKSGFSSKNDILIHNWASEKICSGRYTQYQDYVFWKSGKWLYLRPQNSTRSRPPKAADFIGCYFCLLYNHSLYSQNKKSRYWVYLMEHICFEVQLCIIISIFKEKHVFDILIILCLGTGLQRVW